MVGTKQNRERLGSSSCRELANTMANSGNTVIIRKDVIIKDLSLDLAPNMFRWMCDPAVSSNIGLREKPSLEKTQSWITKALQDPSMRPYAIMYDGNHVGNVTLDRIDNYLSSSRFSIYIGEPSARQVGGVGCTGTYLALREAFSSLGFHKIWLTVHVRNFPAINVYRKLGFSLEGILRDEFWLDGQRINLLYMGLLKEEYERLSVVSNSEEKIV
jgi:RimJ/RimL family protein N-acetyltransferase